MKGKTYHEALGRVADIAARLHSCWRRLQRRLLNIVAIRFSSVHSS